MRRVTYSMAISLDGYIEVRGVGVHLLGRRLYETMLYWETADQDPIAR
jgi:hypothetical protein